MEKEGIKQTFPWKGKMWRGHVRDSRKFRQSSRQLIEEIPRQNSGNHVNSDSCIDVLCHGEGTTCL